MNGWAWSCVFIVLFIGLSHVLNFPSVATTQTEEMEDMRVRGFFGIIYLIIASIAFWTGIL